MDDLERRIRQIYAEADQLYREVLPLMGDAALGYEILYGPAKKNPWALMIGDQPGGDTPSPVPVYEDIPSTCEYATADYRLAVKMRVAFPVDSLLRCTGLNVRFLRAPKVEAYNATVLPAVRAKFDAFSLQATSDIIDLLQPPMLCLFGLTTLDCFRVPQEDVLHADGAGRVLVRSATIKGIPAFAMRHPSGGRPPPSPAELKQIGAYIADQRRLLGP